jgi:exodeoxyribonuclease VII large subunit
VLTRGYAWLSNASGRAVTSVQQLEAGQPLQAVLHDGSADVLVTQVRGRTSG